MKKIKKNEAKEKELCNGQIEKLNVKHNLTIANFKEENENLKKIKNSENEENKKKIESLNKSLEKTEKEAKEIIEYRETKLKNKKVLKHKDEALGNLFDSMGGGQKKALHIVLKSDVAGTSEAISSALQDVGNDEAYIKVVAAGVGGISESDVNLALATESIIFGFNVRADNAAKKLIEENEMVLDYHSIIYELIDDAKQRLSGLLDPVIKEEIVGNAQVLEVFNSPKFGQVAGCQVIEGSVLRNKPVRVLRDNVVIHQGELDSLRRFKDDVSEVKSGTECGIGIKNYKDIKAGDVIEVFDRKEEQQTI